MPFFFLPLLSDPGVMISSPRQAVSETGPIADGGSGKVIQNKGLVERVYGHYFG